MAVPVSNIITKDARAIARRRNMYLEKIGGPKVSELRSETKSIVLMLAEASRM